MMSRITSFRTRVCRAVVATALIASVAAGLPGQEPDAPPTLAIPNPLSPVPEVLVGGQPTPEVLAEAAAAGYKTIVTLRTEAEIDWDEAATVEELGMRFVSMPISQATDFSAANASALGELLADPELRPMLVHCGSGNRVGALFALKAFHVDGLEIEESVEVGRAAGLTRLEPAVREILRMSNRASD